MFASPRYVGDPLNAVRIFNEKEVDEIIVLDIDATRLGREPNEELIATLAAECRMPLCYGGGVTRVDQIERIVKLGVEKVAISAAAIRTPELVRQAADVVGSQSVAVVLDVRGSRNGGYEIFIENGRKATGLNPDAFAAEMEQLGAGEIIINAIDRDGMMQGYDLDLVSAVRNVTSVPLTALGGAGSLRDVADLVGRFSIVGAAAGSLFVFKGSYRAVLINYPRPRERDALLTPVSSPAAG
jgi:cyclase